MRPLKLFVLAGEPSGDALGGALLQGFEALNITTELYGVGGEAMRLAGVSSLFPMSELSVMGIAEVLPRVPALFRRLDQCVEEVLRVEPDILLTIDAPDFSLRLQKRIQQHAPHIRRVHYVAPTVWAWRPERAEKLAGLVHHLLALLPFEPPYFAKHGLACDFVGHPIATTQPVPAEQVNRFREGTELGDAPILLILPGSRGSEISRLGPRFGAAAKMFLDAHPDFVPVLPVAQNAAQSVSKIKAHLPANTRFVQEDWQKQAAFSAANIALAASGTVSLDLAAHDTPMVIGYDVNWVSRQIAKAMVKLDTVTLVNLVTSSRDVPEFLGADCTAKNLSQALTTLLDSSTAQRARLSETMLALGRGGMPPGQRAAQTVYQAWRAAHT